MKKNLSTILMAAVLVLGLGVMAYPTFSDWWNYGLSTRAVTDYSETVASATDEEKQALWDEAVAWNEQLSAGSSVLRELSEEEQATYDRTLLLKSEIIMSYVEIPTIRCTLPIYHGTSDDTLAVGIGHIEGSSLPVGGTSTHCVISGHRGLPSAELFSRLDELKVGDRFMLHTLGTTLTYEVDQILIVEPDQVSALSIVEGEDLCTLVTCTPYGVNTHRLLVRGHRVENASDVSVTADALQVDTVIVACCVAVPVLAAMIAVVLWRTRRRRDARERGLGAGAEDRLDAAFEDDAGLGGAGGPDGAGGAGGFGG